jgi:hypothetical protein
MQCSSVAFLLQQYQMFSKHHPERCYLDALKEAALCKQLMTGRASKKKQLTSTANHNGGGLCRNVAEVRRACSPAPAAVFKHQVADALWSRKEDAGMVASDGDCGGPMREDGTSTVELGGADQASQRLDQELHRLLDGENESC